MSDKQQKSKAETRVEEMFDFIRFYKNQDEIGGIKLLFAKMAVPIAKVGTFTIKLANLLSYVYVALVLFVSLTISLRFISFFLGNARYETTVEICAICYLLHMFRRWMIEYMVWARKHLLKQRKVS